MSERPACPKCGAVMQRGAKTPGGKVRWMCRNGRAEGRGYCYSTTSPESNPRSQSGKMGESKKLVFKRKLKDSKVYIITSAQNGTPVHPQFWAALKTAAKLREAELLVVPIRYKNPTSRWTASQANEEWWCEEVQPYLWNQRKVLNQNLVLLGDVKTQPTASSPLTGFEAISGSSSAILAHTKMQLRTIATPSNRMAKIMSTTGACTVPNYTDSKAGKLGQFHHSLSAVIVEIEDGKRFHIRQLNFDTKTESFTDLDVRYYPDRPTWAPRALGLIQGDSHWDFICKLVKQATYGKGGIVETLHPLYLVWHDLLDSYAVNPHHKGNPFNAIAKIFSGHASIEDEVKRACYGVRDNTPADTTSVVVPANHNDMLRRWIVDTDWKAQPGNAKFYLKTALEMVENTKFIDGYGTWYPSPFPMLIPQIIDTKNVHVLKDDEDLQIGGIEVSMHGDRGPNGSRGSIANHRRLGVKSIIGHSHVPGIEEGAYQVGTSTELRLEYTGGPSGWLNCHGVINDDGKRQLIMIIDGRWRLPLTAKMRKILDQAA